MSAPSPAVLHVCLGGGARSRASVARMVPLLASLVGKHPTAILSDEHPVLQRRAARLGIATRLLPTAPSNWLGRVRAEMAGARLGHAIGARLVHAHGYPALELSGQIARRLRVPLLATCDDAPPTNGELRLDARRPDRAFSSLGVFAPEIGERLGCAVEIAACPIDPRDYGGDHAPPEVVLELGLDPTTQHVGMAADLSTPDSGGAIFVEAAARTLAAIPFCEFVVIGDGAERDRLERLAHRLGVLGRFRFLPHTVGLPRMLSGLDAIAIPGAPRSFPWEALDAAATPVPLVCSDHPVHREVLDGALEVDWTPYGSAADLARWILAFLGRLPSRKRSIEAYMALGAGRGLVRSRPSSTGYDLSSGDMSEYDILADDFTRRRELILRRHAPEAAARRYHAAYEREVASYR